MTYGNNHYGPRRGRCTDIQRGIVCLRSKSGCFICRVNGEEIQGGFDAQRAQSASLYRCSVGAKSYEVRDEMCPQRICRSQSAREAIHVDVAIRVRSRRDARSWRYRRPKKKIIAPMQGKVVRIRLSCRHRGEAGQAVFVIEANEEPERAEVARRRS